MKRDEIKVLPLHELQQIQIDEDNNWYRPEYPRYKMDLAPAKPFLVPSFDSSVVEVLPSEKQNKKICFGETVEVMEIENRWQMRDYEEEEDDDSYEIEIVEGNGAGGDDDADFYLEMIDGEIFYVFETEDDSSEEEEEEGDVSDSEQSSESDTQGSIVEPIQFNISGLMAPNLEDSSNTFESTDEFKEIAHTPQHLREDAEPVEIDEINSKDETVHDVDASVPAKISTDRIASPITQKVPTSITLPPPPTSSLTREGIDTAPVSPRRSPEKLISSPPTTPRSILKACPPSPTKSPAKKKKDKAKKPKESKEKTFTKTFVRAADFDGEHRVYSWEKPTWANSQQLRSTGKGDEIRKGANLAQPITNAKQLIEKGKVKWEKPEWALPDPDVDAKEELIKQIQEGGMNLPGTLNRGRRLKLSINGNILAQGGDIVQPITKATIIKKSSNVNNIANPKILRATPRGIHLWHGEDLAEPVTMATTTKKYQWEKPSWVIKQNLNSTGVREKLKAGQDVAAPIAKSIAWEKPDWTKKRTMGRARSESLEQMAARKEYTWEKPVWAKAQLGHIDAIQEDGVLKPSEKGLAAREGENLARPITSLPHINRRHSEDPSILQQQVQDAQTSTAKAPLRRTLSED
jgi:hypothetical protein